MNASRLRAARNHKRRLCHIIENELQSWDTEKNFKRLQFLSEFKIPFGKYSGMALKQVPLRYLDETICPMPNQLIVRVAREFVDRVVDEIHLFNKWPPPLPNQAYETLVEMWWQSLKAD